VVDGAFGRNTDVTPQNGTLSMEKGEHRQKHQGLERVVLPRSLWILGDQGTETNTELIFQIQFPL
jgi:hypothetical protein